MQTEYVCLLVMAFVSLWGFLPASIGKGSTYGMGWAAGNRTRVPDRPLADWVGRAERAHNNLKDNLPAFIIAILLLGLTNHMSNGTAIAAMVYVAARLIHFVSYLAGFALVRSLSFFAGLICNMYLLISLLG